MDTKQLTIFVPGRLCLFGEHSDWAGLHRMFNADIVPGMAIVTGIEQGIYAEIEKSERFMMHNESVELTDVWVDFDCLMQSNELRAVAASDGYFAYVAGVASYIKDHYNIGGMRITIKKMTLPMKKGLSSSAAVCVLVARAFNLLYGLNLSIRGEMEIAFKGEQRTRSRCGRLDQACAFGILPVCMRFDGDDIAVERLSVKETLYWVFADLDAKKDTIKILSDLNKCYPFAENEKERNVHEALGKRNVEIIERAIEYMKDGKPERLGKLMTEAQEIFDTMIAPASPEQLAAPGLHSFLQDKNVKRLSYGGKGVGSQGDGAVQFLAKDATAQKQLIGYLKRKGLTPYALTITPRHHIRKAIIPVAGFGTRLYPATRYMKKEMMPLVDKDGLTKPAILILLEQLHLAGIEEICLVVSGENDIRFYQDYFQTPLSDKYLEKLPDVMRAYEKRIKEIGSKLRFRIQHERMGFGHAVYQCHDFCGDEAVLLLLGDTLYTSQYKNCCLQMIEAYEKLRKPLISIHKIPLDQTRYYGIVAGEWEDDAFMRITHFVEKPDRKTAEKDLVTLDNAGKPVCYAVFGQYVLVPDVFKKLQENIQDAINSIREIDMTHTLNQFINKGLTGVAIDGHMYDIGNPAAYREAVAAFVSPGE
jgi:UTP-glucose-1-phosphate uridylyltransferase/mevalonate kinase